MNDLMTRMLFGTVIAKNRGLTQSEAFKVGLLTGMDNSKNSFMPVVSAKMMADDKIALENASKELAACKIELAECQKKSDSVLSKELDDIKKENAKLKVDADKYVELKVELKSAEGFKDFINNTFIAQTTPYNTIKEIKDVINKANLGKLAEVINNSK